MPSILMWVNEIPRDSNKEMRMSAKEKGQVKSLKL